MQSYHNRDARAPGQIASPFFNPMARRGLLLIGALLWLLASALPTGAEGQQTTRLGADGLQAILQEIILSGKQLPSDTLSIENFSSRPETMELPAGKIDYRIISQSATRLGRQTIQAMILVNGIEAEEVTLSGDLLLFGEVVCAARGIPRNTVLSEADIEVVRQNITMLGPGFVQTPAAALGQKAKTTLRPGAVLYSRLLKAPELVKRGDVVSIIARSSALRISVPGRVVESTGAQGDTVRVKNLMSRREVYATVISSDEVQVEF